MRTPAVKRILQNNPAPKPDTTGNRESALGKLLGRPSLPKSPDDESCGFLTSVMKIPDPNSEGKLINPFLHARTFVDKHCEKS